MPAAVRRLLHARVDRLPSVRADLVVDRLLSDLPRDRTVRVIEVVRDRCGLRRITVARLRRETGNRVALACLDRPDVGGIRRQSTPALARSMANALVGACR